MSLLEFMQNDEMVKVFYEEYINQKNIPTPDEASKILNFFAMFCIQSSRLGLSEISNTFNKRLESYFYILKLAGFRHNLRGAHSTCPGLDSILTKAFFQLGGERI